MVRVLHLIGPGRLRQGKATRKHQKGQAEKSNGHGARCIPVHEEKLEAKHGKTMTRAGPCRGQVPSMPVSGGGFAIGAAIAILWTIPFPTDFVLRGSPCNKL